MWQNKLFTVQFFQFSFLLLMYEKRFLIYAVNWKNSRPDFKILYFKRSFQKIVFKA